MTRFWRISSVKIRILHVIRWWGLYALKIVLVFLLFLLLKSIAIIIVALVDIRVLTSAVFCVTKVKLLILLLQRFVFCVRTASQLVIYRTIIVSISVRPIIKRMVNNAFRISFITVKNNITISMALVLQYVLTICLYLKILKFVLLVVLGYIELFLIIVPILVLLIKVWILLRSSTLLEQISSYLAIDPFIRLVAVELMNWLFLMMIRFWTFHLNTDQVITVQQSVRIILKM